MRLLDEAARLRALRGYQVLDTPPEPRLDELARAAADVCETPIALVSLVDRERQFFKARIGIDAVETPREGSFCNRAIESEALFEVPDASKDPRFRSHPMVRGQPLIRYYAAAPLVNREKAALGTLCIIDPKPRSLGRQSKQMLQVLGHQVVNVLEERKADLPRSQVQTALDRGLRISLKRIANELRKVQAPPRHLIEILANLESAVQTVDDAVDALQVSQGIRLRPRTADLAVELGRLVAIYQASDRSGTLFSASGDCTGIWDLDRLTQALSALADSASPGPVRVAVRGLRDSVLVTIQARSLSLDTGSLRIALACELVRIMGGEIELSRARGAITLAVCLPRARHRGALALRSSAA